MKISARLFLFSLSVILLSFLVKDLSYADPAISRCTVTGSMNGGDMSQVDAGSTNDFTFTVTNNDAENSIAFIKISRPSGSFTINTGGLGDVFMDAGVGVGPGGSTPEPISVTTDQYNAPAAPWRVEASAFEDGSETITCDGNLTTAIVNGTSPISITSYSITNINSTSATISWTTDVNGTSEVDYGTTTGYGSTKSDNSLTTDHSFVLDNLSANTTYHFNIKSLDGSANPVETGDHEFTTAENATVTVAPIIITNTTTTTRTVTPTPSPTPIPDTTPPSVYVSTDFSKPFAQSPQISGSATDNKDVTKIDYSLDGGHNFLPVDSVGNPGKASTTFSFIPAPLDDGNYSLIIRGTDSSGNSGTSKTYTLVIDRLPPQASGVLFSLGPQIINPESDGNLVALAGQALKITLSDVGGSTQAAVLAKNAAGGASKTFKLTKNSDNGLWSGFFSLDKGEYQLIFSAIDGAGNKVTRDLNKVTVVEKGQIHNSFGRIANAKITVYFEEPVTNSWQVWDGAAYSQNNPQLTDGNGDYNLFLPPGKYYLHIEAFGFKTTDTEFFTIDSPQPVNASFTLTPLKLLFALGPLKIYLPDFSILSVPFKNMLPDFTQSTNSLVGKNIPFFNLSVNGQNAFSSDSLTGKPSVLTFLNTWSPASTEQISILNKFAQNKDFNSAAIVEGEKVSKVYVFQKRGGYSLPVFADPDATLITPYNLSFLPVHYFLDRKGVVQKVIYGALNEEELANTLINISQ